MRPLCLALAIAATPAFSQDAEDPVNAPNSDWGPSDVPNTGDLTYRVPLPVPEGRAGMTPSLALQYSSSNRRNEWLGHGWRMDLGTLARKGPCGNPVPPATYGPERWSLDRFYLNGSELTHLGGGIFHTRRETNWKVQASSSFDGWTAWDPRGNKYTYQSHGAGNVQYLTQVESPHQTGMYFTWGSGQSGGHARYPLSIRYSASSATDPNSYQVVFYWDSRLDPVLTAETGELVEWAYRLLRIEVWGRDVLLRQYRFGYKQSPDSLRSLLTSVSTEDASGKTALPPLTFEYQDNSAGPAWKKLEGTLPIAFVDQLGRSQGSIFTDVNQDGLPDLIQRLRTAPSSSYGMLYQNLGNGKFSGGQSLPGGWTVRNEWPAYENLGVRFGDRDGDGVLEIYSQLDGKLGCVAQGISSVLNGSSLQGTIGEIVVDLNGDGISESIQKDGTILDGASGKAWATPLPQSETLAGVRFTDLNGDGLLDLFRSYGPSTTGVWLNGGESFYPATGLVGYALSDQVKGLFGTYCSLKGGQKLLPEMATLGFPNPGWTIGDINGDGFEDFLWSREDLSWGSSMQIQVLLGGATGILRPVSYSLPAPFVWVVNNYEMTGGPGDSGTRLVDINGDGLLDVARSDGFHNAVWLNTLGQPADLLVRVKGPLGATVSYAYGPAACPLPLSDDRRLGAPRTVVKSVEVRRADGILESRREYAFSNPHSKFTPERGREFRGFSEVEVREYGRLTSSGEGSDSLRRTTRTYYHWTESLEGLPVSSLLFIHPGSVQVAETRYTYHDSGPGVSLVPPYRRPLQRIERTSFEGTPRTTRSSFWYDDFGNATVEWHEGRLDLVGDEAVVVRGFAENLDAWILSALVSEYAAGNGRWNLTRSFYDSLPHGQVGAKGLVTSVESKASGTSQIVTTQYAYDEVGNVVKITGSKPLADAEAPWIEIAYDPSFRLFPIRATNAAGHRRDATYYGINEAEFSGFFGKPARVYSLAAPQAPATTYRHFIYDTFGRISQQKLVPSSKTTPISSTSWSYEPSPGYFTVTRTDYASTSEIRKTTTDSLGRFVVGLASDGANGWIATYQETGPYGLFVSTSDPYKSDALGEPLEARRWTRVESDLLGRPAKVTTPTFGHTVTYRAFGKKIQDQNGRAWEWDFDGQGRLIRSSEPSGNLAQVGFDNDGNVVTSDVSGHTTTVHRDGWGRVIQAVDSDRGTWSWEYDAYGNVVLQSDGKGQKIRRRFDVLSRLVAEERFEDSSELAHHYYDGATPAQPSLRLSNALGLRSAMTDGSGKTLWTYQAMGLPSFMSKTIGKDNFVAFLEYDGFGRLIRHSLPKLPSWVVRQYGPQGLTRMDLVERTKTTPILTRVGYDAAGRLADLTLATVPESTTLRNLFEPTTGRLKKRSVERGVGRSALLKLGYDYYPDGNIQQIVDGIQPKFNQTFSYDNGYRLHHASSPGSYGEIPYEVDAVGNLTKHGSLSLSYQGHRLLKIGAAEFSYDGCGQMTSGWGRTFTYDALNRLAQFSLEGAQIKFLHDGDDRRVRKEKICGNQTTTTVTPFDFMEVEQGTIRYHLAAGEAVAILEIRPDQTRSWKFVLTDHLGSGALVLDTAGNVLERTRYAPYGVPLDAEGKANLDVKSVKKHQYVGVELESGLCLTGPRTYDPRLGRFLQPDPLWGSAGEPRTRNAYSYAFNNPLTYSDPTGFSVDVAPAPASARREAEGETPMGPRGPESGGGGGSGGGWNGGGGYVGGQNLGSGGGSSDADTDDPNSWYAQMLDQYGEQYSEYRGGAEGPQRLLAAPPDYQARTCCNGKCWQGPDPDAEAAFNAGLDFALGLVPGSGILRALTSDGPWYDRLLDAGTDVLTLTVLFKGVRALRGALRTRAAMSGRGRIFVGTRTGVSVEVPAEYEMRVAENGRGSVYQRPGATGNADSIRIMDNLVTGPHPQPDGYVRIYNAHGQPVTTQGTPGSKAATHIPLTSVQAEAIKTWLFK